MHAMISTRAIGAQAVAVLMVVLGAWAPAASAQDAEAIAQQAATRIKQITDQRVAGIGNAADATVDRVDQLDADDASNGRIREAGANGRAVIDNRRERGVEHVKSVAERAVAALRDLDEPGLAAAVARHTRQAIEVMNRSARGATASVNVAVADALED